MKHPRELTEAVGDLFRALPIAGASVVGITAFGAMTGGLYVQSYFETIHAAWAIELVPTSAVIRSGLIGASSLAIAVASTLAMTVAGIARWHTMGWMLGALVVAGLAFYGVLNEVPQATLGRFAWWLDLGVVVFASYAIAILVTMTLGHRTRSRGARGKASRPSPRPWWSLSEPCFRFSAAALKDTSRSTSCPRVCIRMSALQATRVCGVWSRRLMERCWSDSSVTESSATCVALTRVRRPTSASGDRLKLRVPSARLRSPLPS